MSRLRLRKILGILIIGLAVVFLAASAVYAQEPSSAKQPAEAKDSKPAAQEAESKETAAKEKGKEADESEAVRRSPAVEALAHKTGLTIDQAYWASVVFNFAVVLGLIVFLLRKKLPVAFKSRTESIQRSIEEAGKASEEARRRLSEVEGRLSRLDIEIAQMRAEADDSAKTEEQRLRHASEDERKRIVQSAEQEINMAAGAARRELKSYAAELAVDLAGKKIKVGQSADQTLVREFTGKIGKDGN